jgi:hypothetical protein
MPNITSFTNIFKGCTNVKHINFPTLTGVGKFCSNEECLRNTEKNAWQNLFEIHCTRNPDKADIYNNLLKLSNNDYKKVVLEIEMEIEIDDAKR